jgi:nucleoid-associated protein YgaU
MPSVDYERRRFQGLKTRPSRKRTSLQVIVAVIAVAALALAFVLRPGQGGDKAMPSAPAGSASTPTLAARATLSSSQAAPAALTAPDASAMPAVPSEERTHVVAQGDTLSTIAQRYYGDASKWEKIFDANRDLLPNPGSLQLGQKMKIPK